MSTSLSTADRVLVRLPSWLGDVVMAEPVVRALYERHERAGTAARLTLAGPERWLALFDGRFAEARRLATSRDESGAARSWRGHAAALLLDGSTRSAWSAFAAGIALRVGFARGVRGLLLTDAFTPARERGVTPLGLGRRGRFPRWLPRPFGASCVELAGYVGLTVRDRRPRLDVDGRARDAIVTRLAARGLPPGAPFVLANAGARPGSTKGFPAARFAAALDEIARSLELPVVVACAPGEEENARATSAACRARAFVVDDPPADVAELVALTALAALVVGPDSGPRHLAVALGVPVVVICGPTDPRHTAENLARTRLVRVEVACGPCHREACPIAGVGRHACMERIEPEAVAQAALELLPASARGVGSVGATSASNM